MQLKGLIDNHFHFIQAEQRGHDALPQIEEAFASGLTAAVEGCGTGFSAEVFERKRQLAEKHSGLYLALGWYPGDIELMSQEERASLGAFKEQALYGKCIAIGEIGLDYSESVNHSDQQELFSAQLQYAREIGKPVMLHVRDAHADALAVVKEQRIERGVVHCFTGTQAEAKQWLDAGFYLSFSGIITFKNASDVQEAAQYAPVNRIFCETDAPFLAPVPYRGKPNQINYVYYVYERMAELRGLPMDRLALQLQSNFEELYRIKLA